MNYILVRDLFFLIDKQSNILEKAKKSRKYTGGILNSPKRGWKNNKKG